MNIPFYQLDAFTDRPFGGNPAAVCLIDSWLPDETLAAIAAENNLSATAYLVPEGDDWDIRWFTPTAELDLCGHATLASAGVVLRHLTPNANRVLFRGRHSGELPVTSAGDRLVLDFPSRPPREVPVTDDMAQAFGAQPSWAGKWNYLLLVFDRGSTVRALQPDLGLVSALSDDGVIVTAIGDGEATMSTSSPASLPRAKVFRRIRRPVPHTVP